MVSRIGRDIEIGIDGAMQIAVYDRLKITGDIPENR